MTKRSFHIILFWLILFVMTILSISCSGNSSPSPTKVHTQNPHATGTATIIPVSPTATMSLVLATETSETTSASLHLPEKPDEIRALIPSSKICRFPCFLGINPGETDYQSTIEEITRIATSYSGEVKSLDGKPGYHFELNYPEKDLYVSADISTLDQNMVLDLILYPTTSLAEFFAVSDVLGFYEEPDNIFVFTLSEPYGDGVLPFDLFLDYSTRGFLIWYRIPGTKIQSNLLNLCYRPENAPTIFLWSPDDKRTFLDIAPIGKAQSRDAKHIKDIMMSNASNILEILTNSDGFCVQSHIENWKDISEYSP